MTETLATRLQDTVDHLAGVAPPRLWSVLTAEQERFRSADADGATEAGRVAVGDRLPDATLPDAYGVPTRVLGSLPAVVVFYRGAWCPFCNVALGTYQREVLPELAERGVAFVAISPQGPDGTLTTVETNELTFPVLSDHGGVYARGLGLAFDVPDDVREVQLALGNDFARINAESEWALPRPTVLVVDRDRVARLVDVQSDYTRRTEPQAILDAVRAL